MSKTKYPKILVHPAYKPAVIPPVTVNNLDLEKEYLAKGYIPLPRTPRHPRGMRPADIGAPPLAEQRATFEPQLNPASRELLEERKAAADLAAKLGHLPLMRVLEMIEKAGSNHAWIEIREAAIRGKIKLCGIVNGKQKKIKPMWLHYVAFEPDGDVLYFERDAAWQKGVVVPTRASNITVEIAGIDALWPEATQPLPSDKSTKTPDATAGGTVELGSPKRSPPAKKKRGWKPELTQKIEAAMRKAIANGRYTKQALIDQGATNALATEFGASRTPIRTVLNKLALEE